MSKPQASLSTRSLKMAPNPQRGIGGQRPVLGWRNAEPIEGRGLLQEPADERLVEDRRKAFLVERALLVECPGLKQIEGSRPCRRASVWPAPRTCPSRP